MMRYLFGLGLLLVIAGCGSIANPSYQATAMIREALGSATAIVAQANTQVYASPTMTEMPTQTPSITPTLTKTPTPSNTPHQFQQIRRILPLWKQLLHLLMPHLML